MELSLVKSGQVTDVLVKNLTFTNDSGEQINYKRLYLVGVLNGNKREIELKGVNKMTIELVEALAMSRTTETIINQ